jgi:NADH dehydrogenase
MTEVSSIDTAGRRVLCRNQDASAPGEIPYDHLVLALGSVTRWPNVPGLSEHGLELKSLTDAVQIRDRMIELLERADALPDADARRTLLHIVVVGGNFTGVEVAAELNVFLKQACRRYPGVRSEEIGVTLVELSDRILPALDVDLAAYAERKLRQRGIDLRLGTTLSSIQADSVTFRHGESLPARTVIWCAGIQPHPLLARCRLPTTPQGYLSCASDLRVAGHENLWGAGDCASIPDAEGKPYPATAQHAVREGAHLAENIARSLANRPLLPFRYASRGALVPLGCRTGVARVFSFKISGFAAWFLWRSYYWIKMPGWARRIRVALDWTADLFFPRDVVQLGVHRPRRKSEG